MNKLTNKEQREFKRLDRRVRSGKATYAQLLRAFDLKRRLYRNYPKLGA